MVNLAAEHGLDAFIFDMYFIEDSERKLEYKVLNNIGDSTLSMENVKDLFPDPDNDLAEASERAGNIIFGMSFKPQPKRKEPVKKRTAVMERRLGLLKEKGYFRTVDREQYASLFDFYDIETAVDILIEKSAGVYFFQSDPDPDGLQRKYPLVGLYEDRIFPSASLALALRHYGVSFDEVEIESSEEDTIRVLNINYESNISINGFQLTFSDITLIDAESQFFDNLSFSTNTGSIIAFSFDGDTIPPWQGTFLTIDFDDVNGDNGNADLCILDPTFTTSLDGENDYVNVAFENDDNCLDIAAVWYDCNGDSIGEAYIDYCVECVGGNTGLLEGNSDADDDGKRRGRRRFKIIRRIKDIYFRFVW